MSTSVDRLKAIAPQYDGEPTETLETYLEMAAERMDAKAWGRLYEQGAAYLAAHLLTIRDRARQAAEHGGDAGGGVASVSEGGQSISYAEGGQAAETLSEEALGSTSFGMQYLQLRGQLVGTAGFVTD